jgi:hypothetical protein
MLLRPAARPVKKGPLMSAKILRTTAYLMLLALIIYVAVQGAV